MFVRNYTLMFKLIIILISTLHQCLSNIGHGHKTMEDIDPTDIAVNYPVELDDELVVTTIKRPEICDRRAAHSDHVTVNFVGRFDNQDGKIFDESIERPYKFQLGSGRVIAGYERGAPGICVGETRTFRVPPSLAYGEVGFPGRIPGNATLHFTVECLKITDGQLAPPPPALRQHDVRPHFNFTKTAYNH